MKSKGALEQHPLSAMFPAMSQDELAALARDIKEHGQREAVILFDGKVLDGWHRYLACDIAGVKCVTIKHDGSDPVVFALSRNLHRRHLTASQRAAAVVAASTWRPRGAAGHSVNTEPGSGLTEPGKPAKSAPGADLESAAQMAKVAEVGVRTIEQAKEAQRAGLGDAVRDGRVSAKRATEVAKLSPKQRERAVQAIERGEKPKIRSPKVAPTDSSLAEIERLKALLAERQDALDELADTAASVEAIKGDSAFQEMQALRAELRVVKQRRDALMRENAELVKQVKAMRRRLDKAVA